MLAQAPILQLAFVPAECRGFLRGGSGIELEAAGAAAKVPGHNFSLAIYRATRGREQMYGRLLIAALMVAAWANSAQAELSVDSPQTITRQVTVQLIQSALTNGTSPATAFGNATQRAGIEAGIDRIWAQAGIDINFLPTIRPYNNTFAYQGNAGGDRRPSGDLATILTNAASAGVLSTDARTLNLVFVNVVPDFTPLAESQAAGLAWVGGNGINAFIGDQLLTSPDWRDVAASVIAHEIGHNLGLIHFTQGPANLMASSATTQHLTSSQITTARSSNFARLYTPPPVVLAGDYNKNGKVDAADYIVWRNSLNQAGSGLPADGNSSGTIDSGDYTVWRSNFGKTSGSGSFINDSLSSSGISSVPEPNSILCVLIAMTVLVGKRRSLKR